MDGITDVSSSYDPASTFASAGSVAPASAALATSGGVDGEGAGATPALATDSIDFSQSTGRSPDLINAADKSAGSATGSPLPSSAKPNHDAHPPLADGTPTQYDPDTRDDGRSGFERWIDRRGAELGGFGGAVAGGTVGAVGGGALGGLLGGRIGLATGGQPGAVAGAGLGAATGAAEGEPRGASLGQSWGSWIGGHLSSMWRMDRDLSAALRE